VNRRFARIAATASALILTVGLGAGGAALYSQTASEGRTSTIRQVTVETASAAAESAELSAGAIYQRSYKGVVEITVTGASSGFGPSGTQQAQGSGFVLDEDGHVVTNQHVVDGAQSISVTFWNGDSYDARLVGADPSTDVAVIEVDAPASLLEPLSLGDSSDVAVGDPVVAIGSPFGLDLTLTTGVVSGLHRTMQAPNGYTINNAIQTDAAINHGNSGGPLIDAQGQVIGVSAQIESESGGNDGVGFAVPADTVTSIVAQLIEDGNVQHAYLGVSLETIPATAAEELGLSVGVEVAEVRTGSPAAEAGVSGATGTRTVDGREYPTGGDVITAIDGDEVATAEELQAAIDVRNPGEAVELTYVRDGETKTVSVELAARPA